MFSLSCSSFLFFIFFPVDSLCDQLQIYAWMPEEGNAAQGGDKYQIRAGTRYLQPAAHAEAGLGFPAVSTKARLPAQR